MIIRDADDKDIRQIAEIYNYYIATSHATFELDPITVSEMRSRVAVCSDRGYPFLVADREGEICGYAYASKFKSRPAYKDTAEVSVYIRNGEGGKGIAAGLYKHLISRLESTGLHTVIAGISLPNEPSVRLHEKFGFWKVAHLHEVGRKFDRWIDVGYWQLILPVGERALSTQRMIDQI